MFWTFVNPVRHIRRLSGRVEYTLLPSRRSSLQSAFSSANDTEKGLPQDNDEVPDALEDRRIKGVKALVVLLLSGLGGTALYHQCSRHVSTLDLDEPAAAQSELESPLPMPDEDGSITRTVVYESFDPTHVYLAPLSPLPRPRTLLNSRPESDILRTFLETGEVLNIASTIPSSVDIVYLWVNSTDPAFPEAYAERMEEEGLAVDRGQARRWRDNGELRGAVRSSVQSLGDGLRKVHIVSADYPERPSFNKRQAKEKSESEVVDIDLESEWLGTSGQIPEWLDWQAQEEGTADKVNWHFHSDIFRLPRDHQGRLVVDQEVLGEYELVSYNETSDNETIEGHAEDRIDEEQRLEQAWRELSLPSFNSFAIESRVGWITGLNENFILSNDDMFFLTPMSTSDFHHPLLGPVLRLATQLTVQPHVTPDLYSSHGEWGGLQYASELLGRRFTRRSQPYPEHFPKSLTLGMMDEASVMFALELGEAGTRGFRESKRGLADVEMAALASWLRVERWREALLWTWVVAKVKVWDERARDEIEEIFGTALSEGKNVLLRKGTRRTVEDATAAVEMSGNQPLNTRIKFSSLDGHLPHNVDRPSQQCFFTPHCLPIDFFSDRSKVYTSDEIFKLITFQRPQCGDCLIDALVTASGEKGLSAFLPDSMDVHTPSRQETTEWEWAGTGPILPLTNDWKETDFSLDNIVTITTGTGTEPVRLRDYCLTLLSRYVYAIGDTPAIFAPSASARQLTSWLGAVTDKTAMMCINDDVADGNEVGSEVFKTVLERWMDSRWPTPGSWERTES